MNFRITLFQSALYVVIDFKIIWLFSIKYRRFILMNDILIKLMSLWR